jgi:hypothetical protein
MLMRDHVAGLNGEDRVTNETLAPPSFLMDGLKQLVAIMTTYDTSLSSLDSKEADFQPILQESFDPFMKQSETMAKSLGPPDDSIFSLNCLLAARNALQSFDFVTERLSDIQESIEEYATTLTESQYSFFRGNSALQPLLQALAPLTDSDEDLRSIRSLETFQPGVLTQASQTLDDFLPSALMDAMENLKLLQNSLLAREITEAAAERFCEDFEQIEEKLIAADALWATDGNSDDEESLRALFPRTSAEIRVLLS